MNDQLKNYIHKNRDTFEEDFDPSKVWKAIESKTKSENKIFLFNPKIMSYAAAIIILLIAGFAIGKWVSPPQTTIVQTTLGKQYQEITRYYTRQSNDLLIQAQQANIDQNVIEDIKGLDRQYLKLEKEFLTAPITKRESILNAMIQNARTRVELLQYVIDIKKQYNYGKNISSQTTKI